VHTGFFGWENQTERCHLDADGRIILRCNFSKWDGGIDWTDLAQDRDMLKAPANPVMNLRVP
jgi:hypothetical protein